MKTWRWRSLFGGLPTSLRGQIIGLTACLVIVVSAAWLVSTTGWRSGILSLHDGTPELSGLRGGRLTFTEGRPAEGTWVLATVEEPRTLERPAVTLHHRALPLANALRFLPRLTRAWIAALGVLLLLTGALSVRLLAALNFAAIGAFIVWHVATLLCWMRPELGFSPEVAPWMATLGATLLLGLGAWCAESPLARPAQRATLAALAFLVTHAFAPPLEISPSWVAGAAAATSLLSFRVGVWWVSVLLLIEGLGVHGLAAAGVGVTGAAFVGWTTRSLGSGPLDWIRDDAA